MAIRATGALYKGFTFDGIDSRDYGVYISGDAVFNAPERDVEMIDIPGRNGSFVLDKGRFSNIEVPYPAGLFGDTEADFAAGILALRNALASRKGYCRLEDEYNPGEYRLAVYKSGLDVTPAHLRAGEFTITFDCKPQRFLKSGESPISILETPWQLTNPTLFDAAPILQTEGYGEVSINGEAIEIRNAPYGRLALAPKRSISGKNTFDQAASALLNTGDEISMGPCNFDLYLDGEGVLIDDFSGSVHPKLIGNIHGTVTAGPHVLYVTIDPQTFTHGTPVTSIFVIDLDIDYTVNGAAHNYTGTIEGNFVKTSTYEVISLLSPSPAPTDFDFWIPKNIITYGEVIGVSTKTPVSGTIYIDLELGAAYTDGGEGPTSVDNIINMPPELPALVPGENTITYDNTITDLKVIPRWWKV